MEKMSDMREGGSKESEQGERRKVGDKRKKVLVECGCILVNHCVNSERNTSMAAQGIQQTRAFSKFK